MKEKSIIRVTIEPTWGIVEEIRQKVKKNLEGHPEAIVDASVMTASELVENAVKYGVVTADAPRVDFLFEYLPQKSSIVMQVSNGAAENTSLRQLINTLAKIKASEDKAALFTQRLMEMMENPQPGVSQLGLYRIAYEGGFDLDYQFANSKLTITAHRNI